MGHFLSMSMGMRRFTRLTNGFSKKAENHCHAIALDFLYYNFGRVHQRVRKAVLQRAKGKCEREGCGAHRDYPSFLDVHHILGVEKSDRFWNCISVCPNCHREAHTAPNREQINLDMLNSNQI